MPVPQRVCVDCGRCHAEQAVCPRVYIRRSSAINRSVNGEAGEASAISHSAGLMDNMCPHCRALFWKNENFSCCDGGKVHFETHADVCEELVSLLSDPQFMSHIRQYNMSVAMASVGHSNNSLPGICSFILSGKAYHRISASMIPADNDVPKFAQIYLLDVADATNIRMDVQHGALRADILNLLHNIMVAHNPWVRQFRAAARDGQVLKWRWDGEGVL